MNLTDAGLRKFGLVMAGALAAIMLVGLLRGRAWWMWPGVAAGLFVVSGLVFPGLLKPVEWFWMKLAGLMGFVVTHAILTVFFFLVITPAGLLMRLLGKDPLRIRRHEGETFWEETEHEGPCSRPDKPY
jgi:hypothetical protein